MYFFVTTLSVVATEVTLTLTLPGAPRTAESTLPVAPRIVPIDCVDPPGLTLMALGSSTTDSRGAADVRGPVPGWPTSVADLQAVVVASHTIARLVSVGPRIAPMNVYVLGVDTVSDLPSRSTLRWR